MKKAFTILWVLVVLLAVILSGCGKRTTDLAGPEGPETDDIMLAKGGGKKPPPPPADPAIAFVVHTPKADKLMVMNDDGSNQAEVYKVQGITDLYDPSWSPDGQSIAFVQGSFELWRINVVLVDGEPQGSNPYRLLEEATSPKWSPDGDEILFVTCCGPGNSLGALPAAGGDVHILYAASVESRISAPAWSPDALRIAFIESDPQGSSLKILDIGGGVTTVLESLDLGNMTRLDWARTPARDELAFATGGQLYIVDISGRTLEYLMDGWTPSWSPNDTQLVFMTDSHQIAAYDFVTGNTKRLARSGWYPDWRRF